MPPWARPGCLLSLAAALLLPLGGIWWWQSRTERLAIEAAEAQEVAAEEAFEPAISKLSAAEGDYDIDKTIRVIHEIDRAVRREESLDGYLAYMATQDYRGVAPEVLEARREILTVLAQLYAKQVETEQQEALWQNAAELLLSAGSLVSGDMDAGVMGGEVAVAWDGEQAKELLRDWKESQDRQRELVTDMALLETELFDAMMNYTEVYYRYVDEWDQLSVMRDRGYLAVHNGDWDSAAAAAELAISKAPSEKEAHLMLAHALIEQDNPEDDERINQLLTDYIEQHPGSTAPAFTLLGVQHARQGRRSEAMLAFQQGAAYYPKQAEQLTDMLDPYKMRPFLRQSREGNFILGQYKSTMLGAGYYSPDLQMASVLFQEGDHDAATKKVLDHFARRRAQKQWDLLISDIRFCHELLGPNFWQIFPEDHYLDLIAEPGGMLSSGTLNVALKNRSSHTLRNATLVLVLHFTDMYPDDYEPVHAETMPAVLPKETTDFGSLDVSFVYGGEKKTIEDIVETRAILITNEAVLWVDTEPYKLAELDEVKEARKKAQQRKEEYVPPTAERFPEFDSKVDELVALFGTAASMELESRYGNDSVLVTLPRELSILHPIFRLKYGDTLYTASDNLIEGDQIQLRFDSVANMDGADAQREDLELIMASPFGDVVVKWTPEGDVSWKVQRVVKEE